MELWVVYDTDDDGWQKYVDSYWRSYENAVKRFREIWWSVREPDEDEIRHNVRPIRTSD